MREIGYYSDPAVAGDRLVFACDGAIWECPLAGGRADRRTSRYASIATPKLEDADGRLVFSAAQHGPMQLHVNRRGDARSRQVTHTTESCRALWWAADGRVAFSTSEASPFRHLNNGWLVDIATGRLERMAAGAALPVTELRTPAVAYVAGVNPRYWRGYRGGARGEIWIDAAGDGSSHRLMPVTGNVASPVWCQGRVYFISDDAAHPNLFSCTDAGDDLRQHTHSDTLAVHSLASDGAHLVYCIGGDIVRFSDEERPTPLEVVLARRIEGRRSLVTTVGQTLTAVGATADRTRIVCHSARMAFEWSIRKSRMTRLTGIDRCAWVGCLLGGALLTITAGDRDDAIDRIERDRTIRSRIDVTRNIGRVIHAVVSPDGSCLWVANHRFELLVVELSSGALTVLDRSRYRVIEQFDVSPDGALCAYALPVGMHRTVIRLARRGGEGVVAESVPSYTDFSPRFLPDGSVVFLSLQRGAAEQDAMNTTVLLWRAPLQPDPSRAVRLSAPQQTFARVIPLCGGIALLQATSERMAFDVVSQPDDPIPVWCVAADEIIGLGGNEFVMQARGAWFLGKCTDGFPIVQRKLAKLGAVRARINPVARWEETIACAWRIAADEVPLAAIDSSWERVRARYLALVRRACTSQDALEIGNEMLGHLRMSHARMSRPPTDSALRQGALGIDATVDDRGHWRVARVPHVDPQSPLVRGLAEPALGLHVGDQLLTIAGQSLTVRSSPALLLRRKGGTDIRCDVLDPLSGRRRSVSFVALTSERAIRYAEWIDHRERLLRGHGGGRIAYLHLADVSAATKARLVDWSFCHEETTALIADLRFNEGGSFGGEIAEFLARPVIARIRTRRSTPRSIPTASGVGPVIVLTNRFTASGGELLAQSLRDLAGALIIGEQTFGGALGNTVARRMPDGSELLLPELEIVAPTAWSRIEGCGISPDIHVAWCGRDDTLDPALTLALQSLDGPGG